MMSRKVKCLPFLLLSVLVLLAACQPGVGEAGASQSTASEEPFVFTRENMPRLDGSTSTVPLAQAMCAVLLGESPEDVSDLVQFSRTTQSYRNLMAGETDLVLAAEPAPEVLSELTEQDRWLLTPFATDALVFVVNQDNPVDSLTVEEIQKIYTGEITNWSQVGVEDLEIAAFQRNQGAGTAGGGALLRQLPRRHRVHRVLLRQRHGDGPGAEGAEGGRSGPLRPEHPGRGLPLPQPLLRVHRQGRAGGQPRPHPVRLGAGPQRPAAGGT